MNTRVQAFLASLGELFARKTIRGFIERFDSLEPLEPPVRELLLAALDPSDPPVCILSAPEQIILAGRSALPWLPAWLLPWEIVPRRCLVLTSRCLWVVTTPPRPPALRRPLGGPASPNLAVYSLDDILFLEIGYVLLNAWFEWAAVRGGRVERTRVYFNTVGRPLVEEFCAQLRCLMLPNGVQPSAEAGQNLGLLSRLPYSFQSLAARRLLLPGEALAAAALSPDESILLLRTQAHLLVTREVPAPDGMRHGLTSQFIPLKNLRCAVVSAGQVEINLARQDTALTLSLPFPSSPQLVSFLSPFLL